MLYPTIEELTEGNKYNRYELALATAKCARLITDEYVRQHDVAEKSITGNKETDRPINVMIDRELRDEKAVKVAINRIYRGDFSIDVNAGEYENDQVVEETSDAADRLAAAFAEDGDDEDEDEADVDAEADESEGEDETVSANAE